MSHSPGTFVFVNSLFYQVRSYKKAPRPQLCFCIRPLREPMWPGTTDKELMETFEKGCKFMCAQSEADRADWIATMLQGQKLVRWHAVPIHLSIHLAIYLSAHLMCCS